MQVMTTISAQAATEREQARQSDGKFGAKVHGEQNALELGVRCCASCGGEVVVEQNGVTHHLTPDGDIDYDADADHVALDDSQYADVVAALREPMYKGDLRRELIAAGHDKGVVDAALAQVRSDKGIIDAGQIAEVERMVENFQDASGDDDDDEDSCYQCGASLDDGEGSDGLCGNCADQAEATRCPACGDLGDDCRGHAEGTRGSRILSQHAGGNHDDCHADMVTCDDVPATAAARSDVTTDGGRQARIVADGDQFEAQLLDQHGGGWQTIGRFGTEGQARSGTVRADQALDGALVYGEVGPIKRTPWGEPQIIQQTAPGVVQVSTEGHGGIKLSKERNAVIPPALRNRSGWYEEDAESHIVAMYHPEAFVYNDRGDIDDVRASAIAGVKNWYPDQYEQATGEKLTAADSYVRAREVEQADKAAFRAANADTYLGTGHTSGTAQANWLPKGWTAVTAKQDATGDERTFLVPESESVRNGRYVDNVVIDPKRHIDITGIKDLGAYQEPVKALTHDVPANYDKLTESQRDRAERELEKRYRWPDGSVRTLRGHFEHKGVEGKRAVWFGGDSATSYIVEMEGNRFQKVSKAAWDALEIPDTTDERDRASIDISSAERRYERARSDFNRAAMQKAQADLDAARQRYRAVSAAHRATWPSEDEQFAMRSAALRERLAERGIDVDDLSA